MRRTRRLRRLGYGLSTLLGLKRRGVFIPYRHAESLRACDYAPLEPLFAAALPRFQGLIATIEGLRRDLVRLRGPPPAPRFDQAWFPRLDAAAAYALVRRERPRRILEIGSGHSTRFLARAVADGGLACRLTCIDPAPRAGLGGLEVEHLALLLADAPEAIFAELGPGDVLFVDSSHVLAPGSDVDRLLNRALPRLPAGVLVHLHDVFLPDPYPPAWAWRGYNEQSAIACLLQGGGYEPVFASRYLATRAPQRLGGVLAKLPLAEGVLESSLWLRKTAPAIAAPFSG